MPITVKEKQGYKNKKQQAKGGGGMDIGKTPKGGVKLSDGDIKLALESLNKTKALEGLPNVTRADIMSIFKKAKGGKVKK
jgi:hypothetical protein